MGEPEAAAAPIGTATFSGPPELKIANQSGDLVTINLADGSIKFGPDYTPEKAAEIFWSAISTEYGDYLNWKIQNALAANERKPAVSGAIVNKWRDGPINATCTTCGTEQP